MYLGAGIDTKSSFNDVMRGQRCACGSEKSRRRLVILECTVVGRRRLSRMSGSTVAVVSMDSK